MTAEIVKWLMVGLIVVGTLANIVMVGKPRQPLTGNVVAVTALLGALEIVAILAYWS